jgi:hypothetical protein
MRMRLITTLVVLPVLTAIPSVAKAESPNTAVETVTAFLRALASRDHQALVSTTALPLHYRQFGEGGPRPYKRCARSIKDAGSLKDWMACVDRWNPSLYAWLKLGLASEPAPVTLDVDAGNAKAPKELRTLAKGIPANGKGGEWVTGIPGRDIVEYHMLFFVTRIDGHPRVAAFLLEEGKSEAKSRAAPKSSPAEDARAVPEPSGNIEEGRR